MVASDPAGEAARFAGALAFVLREETGYAQKAGGPYVRLVVTSHTNAKRARKGLHPLPLGSFVLADGGGSLIRSTDGVKIALPDEPDGMAFDDHPKDPGGRTGMGILQREYNGWRDRRGLKSQDVWRIGDRELEDIYFRQYWLACRCGELPPGVGEFTFNTAVNCGCDIGARQLQMAAGVRVDGQIGEATIAAVAALKPADVVANLAEAQRQRYPTLRNFRTFGDNWLDRNERAAVFAAAQAQQMPAARGAWEVAITQEIGHPEERTARAHEEPPEDITQSSTAQAAKFADWAARLTPVLPLTKLMHEFTAAGKSMLSLEFALAALSSPDVLTAIGIAVAVSTSCRHVIARRARSILHMGV